MFDFKRFIANYTTIPDSDWHLIQQTFERKTFRKNEMILCEGDICRNFYFLEKGLVRFFINNDGDDVSKYFVQAPFCFTSKESFRNQRPSNDNIQVLQDSVVWCATLESVNGLLELQSWNTFIRKFLHEVQGHMEDLLMDTKNKTAGERYEQLLEKYPDLTRKIPLRHLSTYLGIAPQSLSRIRKRR